MEVPQKIAKQQLYQFATDIARGMEYIASHQVSYGKKKINHFAMQIYELEQSCRLAGEEILQGILGEGLPPGSPNPNTLKFQTKNCHFPHPSSDLAFRQKLRHLFIRLERKQNVSSNAFRIFLFLLHSYSLGFETINTFVISHSSLEKQYPVPDQNGQSAVYPFSDQKGPKTIIPFRGAHTYRGSTTLGRL